MLEIMLCADPGAHWPGQVASEGHSYRKYESAIPGCLTMNMTLQFPKKSMSLPTSPSLLKITTLGAKE